MPTTYAQYETQVGAVFVQLTILLVFIIFVYMQIPPVSHVQSTTAENAISIAIITLVVFLLLMLVLSYAMTYTMHKNNKSTGCLRGSQENINTMYTTGWWLPMQNNTNMTKYDEKVAITTKALSTCSLLAVLAMSIYLLANSSKLFNYEWNNKTFQKHDNLPSLKKSLITTVTFASSTLASSMLFYYKNKQNTLCIDVAA